MINRKYLTTGGIILGKRLDLIKNIINTTKFEKNNVLKEVESQSNRNLILKEDDDKTIKKCVAKTVKAKRNDRLEKIEEHTVYRQKMITSIIKFQKMHMKVWKRFSLVTMLVLC